MTTTNVLDSTKTSIPEKTKDGPKVKAIFF